MAAKRNFEKSSVEAHNYQILETLAKTRRGWVFAASSTVDNTKVAIKVTDSEHEKRQRYSENERDLLTTLNHANVVKFINYINLQNGFNCLITELSPLGDLRKYQEHQDSSIVPLTERRQIVQQLAEGINYIHGQGVVHSDIKPRNILVFENLQVKLCDFEGASKFSSGTLCQLTTYSDGYMAPERVKSKRLPRPELVDVYSLGAVHRAMITGKFPNEGKNRVRLRGDSAEANLVRAMLIFNPRDRITVGEILQHSFIRQTREEMGGGACCEQEQ